MEGKWKWMLGGAGCLTVILVLVMAGLGYFLVKYNQFVRLQTAANGQWAQVEVDLQRRGDLVPNLVATVKGSAKLDEKVYTALAEARARMAGAGTVDQKVAAAKGFESALSRLLVVAEAYPTLASQQGFRQLQDELAGTENRLAVSRKYFNDAVGEYNQALRQIPGNFVAMLAGFKPASFFEAEAGSKAVPKVEF